MADRDEGDENKDNRIRGITREEERKVEQKMMATASDELEKIKQVYKN